jgi:aminoglycoside phosphotransferase family enzyme/adenylate kinase family enzyme
VVRETHSGLVILVGDSAYKVKKPVDLGFLDFTTETARRDACLREVELNRRLAPDVYAEMATFVRPDTGAHEPVIVMRRMPEDLRLSTLVLGAVDVDQDLRALARLIARFHASAQRGPHIAHEGRAARLWHRWRANLDESQRYCPSVLDTGVHAEIRRLALCYIDGRRRLFAARAAAGLVVDGHGDLIAEDIFCLPDYPRVLDCLDFDDRLRRVDVLDDVCFLAMDLEQLGRPDLAARFLAYYAEFSATPAPDSLTHHYIAYRAFVRAKVASIRADQGVAAAAEEARGYADLALRHLRTGEVRLVVVGGLPGTGKTTVASAIADEFGTAVVSTDQLRREIIAEDGRYTSTAKDAVYGALLHRARQALEVGESVVADATWGDPKWRAAAGALARETRSRLVRIECVAPLELAAARAQLRFTIGRDASEADAAVTRALAGGWEPWAEATQIDTSGPIDRALAAARLLVAPPPRTRPRNG